MNTHLLLSALPQVLLWLPVRAHQGQIFHQSCQRSNWLLFPPNIAVRGGGAQGLTGTHKPSPPATPEPGFSEGLACGSPPPTPAGLPSRPLWPRSTCRGTSEGR